MVSARWQAASSALGGVGFAETQDTETGAEALLGVTAGGEDMGDQLSGLGAGLLGPLEEAFRCPFGVFAVRTRHDAPAMVVWRPGRLERPMGGDPFTAVEELDGVGADAGVELEFHQLIRNGVVVAVRTSMW